MKNGVINEISNADYHANRSHISSSGLKMILNNPKEYEAIYVNGEPQEDKKVFHIGTYVHTYILEPHLMDEECAVYDGVRRGNNWEEFKEQNAGKAIITTNELIKIEDMLQQYNASKTAKELVSGGEAEVTVFTELDGANIKVRCDYYHPDYILDVKTTSKNITHENLEKSCFDYDYDLSCALYLDAFNKEMGTNIDRFIFLFLGKSDGKLGIVEASKEFIENGRRKYKKAIELYKQCKETGVYPFRQLGVPDDQIFRG